LATGRRKLLVADDSPTVQKVISLTFEDEGVEVVTASDGAEALRLLAADPPPDVILADAVMPAPNGYELCGRVKRDERLRHVPVVLLVGTFEPFNEAEARRVGAETVLTKPFQSIRDLVSKVGSLIGGESKEAEHGERAEAERAETPAAPSRIEAEPARDTSHARVPETLAASVAETPRREREDATASSPPLAGEEPPASVAAAEPFQPDPSSSFADLGIDDEMIETRSADAFGAPVAPAAHTETRQATEERSPAPAAEELFGASFEGHAQQTPHAQSAQDYEAAGASGVSASTPTASAEDVFEVEPIAASAPQAFAARAAAASTADDALLDLGGFGPPASAATAEADDFILDLEDEPAAPAAQAASFDAGVWDEPLTPVDVHEVREADVLDASPNAEESARFDEGARFDDAVHVDEAVLVDEAGGFAEAAHGETAAAPSAFGFDSTPTEENEIFDPEITREVVAQDVPPQSDTTAEYRFEESAPRDFIEPTVVPANEPVPATFASEFTDGSVEGDLPRSPAATASAGTDAARQGEPAAPSASVFPTEPSTEGYAMGQARIGVDERPAAGRLTPEEIDAIARRVVEMMSEDIVREIAWEVVPDLAELLVKRKLEEERGRL
jgi:CheY-like chemotaxis protein